MKKLEVFLNHSPIDSIKVGTLAGDLKNTYFEYDQNFLSSSFDISPFMLKKSAGVQTIKSPSHLQGLWGVFHDSLPDGWGLLLMDRFFRKQRINLESISLIDRLNFVGTRGSGALIYHPSLSMDKDKNFIDLEFINNESQKILSGNKEDIIPELLKMGGSPGGARPKIFVGLNDKNEVISGSDDLPLDFEHWIIKFNSKGDNEDFGAIEYAYSQIAAIAGLKMSETKLIVANNKRFFGTKRFDRDKNKRFHLHTLANLIGANFRMPSTDYLDIMKTSYALTKSNVDLENILKVMIFNIMAHNRDDHAKNFSFIMNHKGEWYFAPAYDLTFSHGPGGEHSNTIMGEGKNPTIKHIVKIAEEFSIKKSIVNNMIDQTAYAISQWKYICSDLDISKKQVNEVQKSFLKIIS